MKQLTVIALLFCCLAKAQTINDYKYVIVPSKFSFLNDPDKYRLNTLTKLLLGKYGFEAYLDTDPEAKAMRDHNCDKLYADVDRPGGFMVTKLVVQLKDCNGNVLYATEEGSSKEKEFNIAYNMALREAFNSFDELSYKYNGGASIEKQVVRTVNNGSGITKEIVSGGTSEMAVNSADMLFAQPAAYGFQLVDSTPKVVMKLMRTASAEIFLAEKGDRRGVAYQKGGSWFFDYYINEQLISEPLNVRF